MKITLSISIALGLILASCSGEKATDELKDQEPRVILIMFDGFGMSYYKAGKMPFLKEAASKGLFKEVQALMPTVTNLNNASIATGTFPEKNGIIGNSFLNEATGKEEYMENKDLLMAPTLFQRLDSLSMKSALLASKKKSIYLLPAGADLVLSPEVPDSAWIQRLGKPPGIYSAEINYWTMEAGLDILKNQKDVSFLYIHPTDYPMHMWAPEDPNEQEYLTKMDEYIERLVKEAPDAMILITADHDVNHKDRCIDIEKMLAEKKIKVKAAISVEKDKYPKHHGGFGGTSYVYLLDAKDSTDVKRSLLEISGVKTVLSREEAASKFHLMPSRIGDLIVLADSMTVFGNLTDSSMVHLPPNYRTHGSEYETRVPLIVLNPPKSLPKPSYFVYNKDLTAWLFDRAYSPFIQRTNH